MTTFDLVVKNVRVVNADAAEVATLDLGIKDGSFARIAPGIDTADAAVVIDGGGKLAFPGVIDVHQHWGIYNDLSDDTSSESKASAQGGVTTGITYMRTGQYYMNRTGPYREFIPHVLAASESRSYVDYAFHIAPILKQHIDEIPDIIDDFGIPSFKIFMYSRGGEGLRIGLPDIDDGFLFRLAEAVVQSGGVLCPHCENIEVAWVLGRRAMAADPEGKGGLAAWNNSRPPFVEAEAVHRVAAYYIAFLRLRLIMSFRGFADSRPLPM